MKPARWMQIFCTLIGFCIGAVAPASAITFLGASGTHTATVTFAEINGQLVVTLANISNADARSPKDVLTGVFFKLQGDPLIHPVSAVIPVSSIVMFGSTDSGGVVGGEWAYKNHLTKAPKGADEGISSSGRFVRATEPLPGV